MRMVWPYLVFCDNACLRCITLLTLFLFYDRPPDRSIKPAVIDVYVASCHHFGGSVTETERVSGDHRRRTSRRCAPKNFIFSIQLLFSTFWLYFAHRVYLKIVSKESFRRCSRKSFAETDESHDVPS